jgi:D-alanyl-D-alanine carboxypeptidase/D-alanyl-D-alanine-endopeptidase (penicillin-binding protein 4)
MADVLRYAYQHPDIYQHLRKSLPVAGIDGTLQNRMKKTSAYRRVFAKTGTLTGVTSLAGYAIAPNGHTLAFVIINQNILTPRPARAWQDKVCDALCK